jgi:hypothetical protein
MAKGFLGIDWGIVIDNALFGGAEQEKKAAQYEREVDNYVKEYTGELQVWINDNSLVASCNSCGRTFTGNYSELPGGFYLCEGCTNRKVEQMGYDSNGLPWNQWKSGRKPPIRLG